MAGLPLQKLSELEHAMATLAEAQVRTEANLDRYAAEGRASLDRYAAESRADFDRYAAESRADFDRRAAENDKLFAALAASIDKANRESGEATRRAGRLVEDLVGPNVVSFFQATFSYDGPVSTGIRLRLPSLTHRNDWKEFDVFAASPQAFLLVSVKSTVRPENLTELIDDLTRVRDFFPQAQGSEVFGAMASLFIDSSVVTAGERRGLYMLGLRTGLLSALNSEAFKPKAF